MGMKEYIVQATAKETIDVFDVQNAPELIRCKDCKWYDERISMCDNCGLPREQTFFCADGKGGEVG